MMNYEEIKTYLLSPQMNVSKPGLDRIKAVLASFGNPEKDLKVIHIVGTNGKGSVSQMISRILVSSGIKTGLFSSPYISELTEYIFYNNSMISQQDFAGISELIINKLNETGLELTHFEFVTVLSVLYFCEKKCVCIYEAGMGGIEDATNIFENVLCTVLTSVSLDHTAYLGNTLEEIVAAKAGIARKGETLIFPISGNEPTRDIVRSFCVKNDINLVEANTDNVLLREHSVEKIVFDYNYNDTNGHVEKFEGVELNTGALYQIKNAVAAITAVKYLYNQTCMEDSLKNTDKSNGFIIHYNEIKKGLFEFTLKSRFEILRKNPFVIVDGGHNPDCVKELVKSLEKGKKYKIVTGVMADKDYAKMYDILHEYAECFICVDNGLERALPSAVLCEFLGKYKLPAYDAGTTLIAAAMLKRMCAVDDRVLFLGTLYMTDRFKEDVELVYNDEKINIISAETVSRLTSKSFYSKNYSLDEMKVLLKEFGSPQNELNVIHIAGTNGKGSTCSMIYAILTKMGLKAGLFTSPFIRLFNERIAFDGRMIEDEMLVSITEAVLDAQDRLRLNLNQFALVTCIAFIYYKLVNADVVVLETGLGGTFDPTNIVEKPLCSVITNIGFDHMAVLGNTIEEIACSKAGIIKNEVPVVCYPVERAAFKVVEETAKKKSSALYKVLTKDIMLISSGENGTEFRFKDKTYHVSLSGDFQAYNASVAITTVTAIWEKLKNILNICSDCYNHNKADEQYDTISTALGQIIWQGRLELISKNPLCFLDGGHNVQCIKYVTDFFRKHYTDRKKIYIAGFMKDKDYRSMIRILAENADILYLVPVKNERSLSILELTKEANQYNIDIEVYENLTSAYKDAISNADNKTVICVTGSLYQLNEFYSLNN